METPIAVLYAEYKTLTEYLNENREISFQLSIDILYRKSLVLAAASYFETEITSTLEDFYHQKSGGDNTVMSFVKNKAIKRQYHTYFSWEKNNGYTQFFGLLGQDFQLFIKEEMKINPRLTPSLEAFIRLGYQRNLLTHLNYASYDIGMTASEIYNLFETASYFVNNLSKLLKRVSLNIEN